MRKGSVITTSCKGLVSRRLVTSFLSLKSTSPRCSYHTFGPEKSYDFFGHSNSKMEIFSQCQMFRIETVLVLPLECFPQLLLWYRKVSQFRNEDKISDKTIVSSFLGFSDPLSKSRDQKTTVLNFQIKSTIRSGHSYGKV